MRSSDAHSRKTLQVAFDATPLLESVSGVGAFCAGVLAALPSVDGLRVKAFLVSWRRRERIAEHLAPGVGVVDKRIPSRPVHRAWRLASCPPIEWWTGRIDVVHGTNFVVPPTRRAARVVTVHDLTVVRFPELCDAYTRTFPAVVRKAIHAGAWVHTHSGFVRDEVIDLLGALPERVRAVHPGVPPVGPHLADPGHDADREAAGWLPDGPYVLALGTIEPRKDLPTLVRAFDHVADRHRDLSLVVAGRGGWGMEGFEAAVARSPWQKRLVRLGYVSEQHRARLLCSAAVFAFPSVYEGFGFPPLEAMAAGVPVVTTTAGALPEVVGDAATVVAPGDADAMAAAVDRLLVDDAARAELVAKGRQRVKHFSWGECAAGLAALYRDASAELGR